MNFMTLLRFFIPLLHLKLSYDKIKTEQMFAYSKSKSEGNHNVVESACEELSNY